MVVFRNVQMSLTPEVIYKGSTITRTEFYILLCDVLKRLCIPKVDNYLFP